jgi:probable F420-dependent oxidoreductase
MELGKLGVWSVEIRKASDPAVLTAAAELEHLGYGAIWYSAGSGMRGFDIGRALAAATSRIAIATGITSIWATAPEEAGAGFRLLEQEAPGRFLLGLGVSHAPMVNRGAPGRYRRPLAAMARYLDEVTPVPKDRRVIAALGPKMLDLAERESVGTHPYLITPPMTEAIRAQVKPDTLIAVEQAVILETDSERARAIAREHLNGYLTLPNYTNNWLRAGYTPQDIAEGGSNRLIDGLIAWGDIAAVGDRIRAHWAAGADHVCVQILGGAGPVPVPEWQAIAREVLGA